MSSAIKSVVHWYIGKFAVALFVALFVAIATPAANPNAALPVAPGGQQVVMLANRRLGKLQLEGYDDEETTAKELGVSTRTLKTWRRLRIGPPVTFIGRRPAYNRVSKQAWLKSREQPMLRERRRTRQREAHERAALHRRGE
jgi:hypothetical protein